MKIKVKKLWHNAASIRDYVVKECQAKGEDLEIEYRGEVMTVPNNMLLFGHRNGLNIVSKFKGEVYDLMDFTWRPDLKPKTENTLF